MPTGPGYRPAPVWPALQPNFSDVVRAATFPRLQLRFRNQRAAAEIGLDSLDDHEWIEHFGALAPLPRNIAEPLALRYHGHQFQSYNPWLGDGRGFLLAQLLDDRGRVMDLGTKGSGTTPYSRGGDGRLTLKGAVREILATEMLQALGVNTSRTLSVIETGESLVRHDEPSPTRAAVMVRLSWSHVRFGSFQRHAWERSTMRLRTLLHFAVDSWFPELAEGEESDLPERFLDVVVDRSARLVAEWTMAGFVHGVLNTDNMNVTGESFDYGPWRFLPTYDPEFTAAYFDRGGLYAFGRQGDAMFWNLCRLADALLSISSQPALEVVLKRYEARLARHSRSQLLARLGVSSTSDDGDRQLLTTCFSFLGSSQIPYERLFFDWFGQPGPSRTRSVRPVLCGTGVRGVPRRPVRPSACGGGPAGPPVLRRRCADDHADRRDGGALVAHRRGRRLVGPGPGHHQDPAHGRGPRARLPLTGPVGCGIPMSCIA